MSPFSARLQIAIVEENQPTVLAIIEQIERSFENHKIVFTADTMESAEKLFLTHQPNLAILDIDAANNKATLFSFLQKQQSFNFNIIFLSETIQKDFSKAFNDWPVINYLLKPVDSNLLDGAIKKAILRMTEQHIVKKYLRNKEQQASEGNKIKATLHNDEISLPLLKGRKRTIPQKDIIRCESMGDLSLIVIQQPNGEEKVTLNINLKDCKKHLDPKLFYRVHYQHIINMAYVKSAPPSHSLEIALSNGEKIPLARRRRKGFLESHVAVYSELS
jgi:two-component system, LytTR family, response regulator